MVYQLDTQSTRIFSLFRITFIDPLPIYVHTQTSGTVEPFSRPRAPLWSTCTCTVRTCIEAVDDDAQCGQNPGPKTPGPGPGK